MVDPLSHSGSNSCKSLEPEKENNEPEKKFGMSMFRFSLASRAQTLVISIRPARFLLALAIGLKLLATPAVIAKPPCSKDKPMVKVQSTNSVSVSLLPNSITVSLLIQQLFNNETNVCFQCHMEE